MTVTSTPATSQPPRRGRRIAGWAALILAIAVVGSIGALISQNGQWSERAPLDPESTGPDGARAIARVLAEQGVEVQVVRDRDAAMAALDGDETLLLPDAPGLSDESLTRLAEAAGDVVLAEPRSRTLRLLVSGSTLAGAGPEAALPADCAAPAAGQADEIVAGDLYSPGDEVTGCYPVDGAYALLTADTETGSVAAVDALSLFTNENVTRADNAALALTLLGGRENLVWYMPSPGDGDAGAHAPTLGELTPPWVTPSILLLIVAAIGAGIWRGRRFGPLVAENLPVTVRATETTIGRGRLYERSRDAAHAIDQLRGAAVPRLARTLGLAASAAPGDVADAAAARLNVERAVTRSILIDTRPTDDRALVELSDRLIDLEARVRAAVRPSAPSEGTTP